MVRELISKTKNGNAAGPSGLVAEIVKSVREAGIDRPSKSDNNRRGYPSNMTASLCYYLLF